MNTVETVGSCMQSNEETPFQPELSLSAVLNSLPDAVYVVDTEGRVITFNDEAASLSWLHPSLIVGKKCHEVFKCTENIESCPLTRLSEWNGGETMEDVGFRRPDGELRYARILVTPVRGDDSKMAGAIVHKRDITEEKIHERRTSEFIAVAAHELRTPMTTIKAYVSLLLSERFGPLNERQILAMQTIDRNLNRLVKFTSDILEVSGIEGGRLTLSPAKIDILDVVNGVLRESGERLKQASLTAKVYQNGDTLAKADEDKLSLVISNLLENAIRFSDPHTEVTLRIESNITHCVMSVSNYGKGIQKEKLPYIFNTFYQCDGVDSACHAGTGLGLSICKGLVNVMGGRIWAENHPDGRGVTFVFTIPRWRTEDEIRQP